MASACDSVRRLLSPYVDDELSGAERKVVDGHVQGCAACQARLVDVRATAAAMQAYLTQRAEGVDFAAFTQRVMAQVKKEPLPLMQRLRLAWSELMAYHAAALYSACGAGLAASLAVGLVMLRSSAGGTVADDDSLVVRSLSVSDPRYEPVVMHTDDGKTVIMLVEHSSDGDDAAAASPDAKKKAAADKATPANPPAEPATRPAPVPREGEL